MGSVCCGVCWKSSVWMMILVWEQVWGWHDGGAEKSGVILILGLCAVRLYQAPKGKAVGFNPEEKTSGFGSLHHQGGGKPGVWPVDGGSSMAGMGSPTAVLQEKKEKKGKTGRKSRFYLSLGPSRGCACSLCAC